MKTRINKLTLTNATAIGANSVASQNNSLILGNNANIGIGTSTPNSKLTVAGLIETTVGGVKFPDGTIQTTVGGGNGRILNQTTLQTSANFNIDGTGTANIFNAAIQFNKNGQRVLRATMGDGSGSLFE
jgi:hypothetical protein